MEPVLLHGLRELSRQVNGAGEVNAVSHLCCNDAKADGQMRFAHAWWSKEDYVSSLGQETAGRQLVDQAPVKTRLGSEVEVLQSLEVWELGELEA
jgi:hypothetical protein